MNTEEQFEYARSVPMGEPCGTPGYTQQDVAAREAAERESMTDTERINWIEARGNTGFELDFSDNWTVDDDLSEGSSLRVAIDRAIEIERDQSK